MSPVKDDMNEVAAEEYEKLMVVVDESFLSITPFLGINDSPWY